MLHCYILPKITLCKDDLDKVTNAREKQALNIQMLDRKVIEECKTIDACELQMEDLRTQFLPDLEGFINKGWCSKGFLDLLLEDVSREEPRLRQQVHAYIYRSKMDFCLFIQNALVESQRWIYSFHFCDFFKSIQFIVSFLFFWGEGDSTKHLRFWREG